MASKSEEYFVVAVLVVVFSILWSLFGLFWSFLLVFTFLILAYQFGRWQVHATSTTKVVVRKYRTESLADSFDKSKFSMANQSLDAPFTGLPNPKNYQPTLRSPMPLLSEVSKRLSFTFNASSISPRGGQPFGSGHRRFNTNVGSPRHRVISPFNGPQSPKYFSLLNPVLQQQSTVKIASPDLNNRIPLVKRSVLEEEDEEEGVVSPVLNHIKKKRRYQYPSTINDENQLSIDDGTFHVTQGVLVDPPVVSRTGALHSLISARLKRPPLHSDGESAGQKAFKKTRTHVIKLKDNSETSEMDDSRISTKRVADERRENKQPKKKQVHSVQESGPQRLRLLTKKGGNDSDSGCDADDDDDDVIMKETTVVTTDAKMLKRTSQLRKADTESTPKRVTATTATSSDDRASSQKQRSLENVQHEESSVSSVSRDSPASERSTTSSITEDKTPRKRFTVVRFPSKSQKDESIRRPVPLYCASFNSPDLPQRRQVTHKITKEDIESDRKLAWERVKHLLDGSDDEEEISKPKTAISPSFSIQVTTCMASTHSSSTAAVTTASETVPTSQVGTAAGSVISNTSGDPSAATNTGEAAPTLTSALAAPATLTTHHDLTTTGISAASVLPSYQESIKPTAQTSTSSIATPFLSSSLLSRLGAPIVQSTPELASGISATPSLLQGRSSLGQSSGLQFSVSEATTKPGSLGGTSLQNLQGLRGSMFAPAASVSSSISGFAITGLNTPVTQMGVLPPSQSITAGSAQTLSGIQPPIQNLFGPATTLPSQNLATLTSLTSSSQSIQTPICTPAALIPFGSQGVNTTVEKQSVVLVPSTSPPKPVLGATNQPGFAVGFTQLKAPEKSGLQGILTGAPVTTKSSLFSGLSSTVPGPTAAISSFNFKPTASVSSGFGAQPATQSTFTAVCTGGSGGFSFSAVSSKMPVTQPPSNQNAFTFGSSTNTSQTPFGPVQAGTQNTFGAVPSATHNTFGVTSIHNPPTQSTSRSSQNAFRASSSAAPTAFGSTSTFLSANAPQNAFGKSIPKVTSGQGDFGGQFSFNASKSNTTIKAQSQRTGSFSFTASNTTSSTQNAFGSNGTAVAQNAFGSPSTQNAFGSSTAQNTFVASTPQNAFRAPPVTQSAFGAPTTQNAFGAPSTQGAFGAPSTQSTAFGSSSAKNAFGNSSTQSAFAAPALQGGFGASATQNAFGASTIQNAFGAQASQGSGSSGTYNFGGSNSGSSGGFNFGNASSSPSPAGFVFGAGGSTGGFTQENPAAGAPAFGGGLPSAPSGGFNFGSSTPTVSGFVPSTPGFGGGGSQNLGTSTVARFKARAASARRRGRK